VSALPQGRDGGLWKVFVGQEAHSYARIGYTFSACSAALA
jgi:hypothetical protein